MAPFSMRIASAAPFARSISAWALSFSASRFAFASSILILRFCSAFTNSALPASSASQTPYLGSTHIARPINPKIRMITIAIVFFLNFPYYLCIYLGEFLIYLFSLKCQLFFRLLKKSEFLVLTCIKTSDFFSYFLTLKRKLCSTCCWSSNSILTFIL